MMGRGYYGYDMMGGGLFGGLLMVAFWLLVLAGIVVLIIWAVRELSGRHGMMGTPPMPPAAQDEPMEIARRRLAAGEITVEQFDEIKRTLSG